MKPEVQVGLYTVTEAACYARLHHTTAHRWIQLTRKQRQLGPLDNTELDVSFLDFVQLLAVRALRREGVTLPRIREAVEVATKEFSLEYPLAHKDNRVYSDGRDVHIKIGEEDSSIQLSGKHRRQRNLPHVEMVYLRDLSFDEDNRPTEYHAFKHRDVLIFQRPGVSFGAPMVRDTPFTAIALADAVKAEGSIEAAAGAFGASVDQVEAAVRYIDFLDKDRPAVAEPLKNAA